MVDTLTAADEATEAGGRRIESLLFLELECEHVLAGPARWSLAETDLVQLGRADERHADRSDRSLSIGVPDPRMSSSHARMVRIAGRWILEDRGSKNGTIVNGDPIVRAILADGDVLELGRTLFLYREIPRREPITPDLDARALTKLSPEIFRTLSPALGAAHGRLREIAVSSVAVLVRGESGTGKELVARAIHRLSKRKGKLVAVNCGALPSGLVESELFGHEKGAFSGAVASKLGFVRSADRGTLLLDEIGDLPLQAQSALLRVLQEGEVQPLGAAQPVKVDVRVVCATHRNLRAMADSGTFRRDLLARIAGYELELPPLRERREDLGILIGALLRRADAEYDWAIDPAAARAIFRNDWRLNVRELEQALRAAAALAKDGMIRLEQLPSDVVQPAASRREPMLSEADRELADDLREKLTAHSGNIAAVARALGKDRAQIRRWLRRLGIDANTYR